MRTLEKNKTILWLVNPATYVDVVDDDGFETGERQQTFGTPVEIRIALYPASGRIKEEIFGRDYACDKIAVSNDVILTKDSFLFYSQPTENFDTTYDLIVDKILPSLNTYNYGLRSRV